MNDNIQAQAEIAAQWWVERLTPVHGDSAGWGGEQGAMLAALQTMNALESSKSVTSESRAEFKAALITAIVNEANDSGDNYRLYLGVDYNPEGALRDALQSVANGRAIADMLPYKHRMYITPETVEASAGYRASRVKLWSKPE